MILVYAPRKSNRLSFILDTIFKSILKTDYKFTAEKNVFEQSELPKLSYGEWAIDDEIFIKADEILFEKDIEPKEIAVAEWQGMPILFAHDHTLATIPFDLFAASFYLISRYEEYLPSKKDMHGRFDPLNSIAHKYQFIERPLVDEYAMLLRQLLLEKYPDLELPIRPFQFIPTFDIDNAFAYLYKGFWRGFLASAKSLVTFKFKAFAHRVKVLSKSQPDPYDTFAWIKKVHQRLNTKPILFYLLGDYGKYDKNIPYNREELQELIKETSQWAHIGIHPSYHTPLQANKLKAEIKRLNTINNQITTKSRQHFLRLLMPIAYQNILQSTIVEDYTMGYAPVVGFRASTCTPHYFFDIKKDERSILKVYPFCFMDSTWRYYLNQEPETASIKITELMTKVQEVGGVFITLFHNDTFEHTEWKWVYEKMLDQIQLYLKKEDEY
ncbi:MAG: polysaccharide deacetylase family protein [Bacteroidota bacterium]